MKLLFSLFLPILFLSSLAKANDLSLGLNLGLGFPYVGQTGVHLFIGDMFAVSAEYNILDLSMDEASVELKMPAIMGYFYPFSGSFYIAAGVGKESLDITATETTTNNSIRLEVDATTTILKTGWMWGKENGGFWFGIDLSYISPSSADTTITAPGVATTDPNYQDALEAADDFGDTAYPNLTFMRFGWIF